MGEEDVGGFDVPVDDAEGMEVGEGGEEVVEVGFEVFGREMQVRVVGVWGAMVVEEGVEIEREEGKDEGEFAAGEAEGGVQGDDVCVRGFGEDPGFTHGVVGGSALGWDGEFEGYELGGGRVAGFVDGGEDAGAVVCGFVGTDLFVWASVIIVVLFREVVVYGGVLLEPFDLILTFLDVFFLGFLLPSRLLLSKE